MKRAKKLIAIMLAAMMVSSTIDYSGMVVVNAEENDVVTETAAETEAVAGTEADTEIVAETEKATDTAMATGSGTGTEAVNENEAGIEKQNVAESQAVGVQSGTDTSNAASEVLAELPDNDTLYEGYVQNVLYGNGIETYGLCAGDNLTGQNKELYDDIKARIKNVAANGGTTAFSCFDTYGVKYKWKGINYEDARKNRDKELEKVISALLLDCPYEMYWYDTDKGYSAYGQGGGIWIEMPCISFAVNSKYCKSSNKEYEVEKEG